MTKSRKIAIAAVAAVAIGAGGAGLAIAGGSDDDEAPISGSDLDRASQAALAHTGGGEVTDTEIGDEESYYEVEVTDIDGSQTDVQLDRSFDVVGDETDAAGDDEGNDDD
jgi:uncharacterized membrane protein YkoI